MLGRLVGWIATTFDRAESSRNEEGRRKVAGSGDPHHDPAYSGTYTVTRRLERMEEAPEERERRHDELRRERR
jgi:hypothetical protein